MSIGWTISVGYISGYTSDIDKAEAWELLQKAADTITRQPVYMAEKAAALGCPMSDGEYGIEDFAKQYRAQAHNPLVVDRQRQQLHIMASGGGVSRTMKEHMARAFVRILLEVMHSKGIDLCVHVS